VKIGEKLTKCGYPNVYDKAMSLAQGGQITRSHFARILMRDFGFRDMQSTFDKLLGKGKKAYVKPMWPQISEAVEVINQAGGKAVIAHPANYRLTGKWMRRLITEFKSAGGTAIEVVHSKLSVAVNRQMASYANEYELEGSTGSDFHGPNRWCELGRKLALPENVTPVWHDWSLLPEKELESA
jgi:predicted metal-dependent phosphoesterase TrpH